VSSIVEIEDAVRHLSREDFAKFSHWFSEQRNLIWDRQIEEDSASGKLDRLLKEVDDDIAKGRTRPTDELLDNR